DTWGHQTGDVVLRRLTEVVHAGIRAADMLFRWGGEEFVVLTVSTGHRKARVLAESLRTLVELHEFPVVGRVTVSIGVAEYTDGESAGDWFRRLDEALYSAKSGGRNFVFESLRGNSNRWSAEGSASPLRLLWQESYECGEQSIDHEHRALFDLANALINASFEREAYPLQFEQRLESLLTHLAAHLEHEERILEAHGYALLDVHRRGHETLLARAAELKQDVQAGNVSTGELVEFLASTIVTRHLFSADREYFPLFTGKGG
ncbi:MAG: diguanylate cyclase, partial [Betaproteobacteria bacterium]|nr:diguanylate cyclase [Betaproteobacteria bacterium]